MGRSEYLKIENIGRRRRYTAVFAVLCAALFVAAIINIGAGSVDISAKDICRIIFFRDGSLKAYNIVWVIRLPRMIMAAVLGGSLALSGYLLQTFFENPIAGPYVLGISSGAKMAVALTMIYILKGATGVSSWLLITAAFVGSLLATGLVLLFSKRLKSMATLLIAGIMIGYICSAVTDFVVTFAENSDIVNLHNWSQGSFSGMNWGNVRVASIVAVIAFILIMLLSKSIGAYRFGEVYAKSIGVNVKAFRVFLVLLSSLLSATVTAFAGPVAFVGIAAPYLIKQLLGTSKPLVVIPAAFLGGAVFCLVCDLVARTAFSPIEMNLSAVTAMFGAPVVIVIMLRRKRG